MRSTREGERRHQSVRQCRTKTPAAVCFRFQDPDTTHIQPERERERAEPVTWGETGEGADVEGKAGERGDIIQ